MSFIWGSGSNKTDRKSQLGAWGDLSSLFGFASPTGKSDVTSGTEGIDQSKDYFSSLLSGDMSKITQTLAPQISGIRERADQRERTGAEFSNRSGGTNAIAQHAPIDEESQIQSLISDAISGAGSKLGALSTAQASIGENLLSLAESSAATRGGQAGAARQNDINNAANMRAETFQDLAAIFKLFEPKKK